MLKMQNGEYNVTNFGICLFGMSSDVLAFQVYFLASDFEFLIEVN